MIERVEDHIWLVSFMDYDLAILTTRHADWNYSKNLFGPKVLPKSPV